MVTMVITHLVSNVTANASTQAMRMPVTEAEIAPAFEG